MRRLFPALLLLGIAALARAQEKDPVEPAVSPDNVTLVPTAAGHIGPITELIFTDDGKKLISCGTDRTVQVWDTTTGERLRVFHPPAQGTNAGAIKSAALSSDGKTLALLVEKVENEKQTGATTFLLNLDDGRVCHLPDVMAKLHLLAFAPSGARLAVGGDNKVLLWSGIKQVWDTDPETFSQRKPQQLDAPNTVFSLAFSPDSKALAVGCFMRQTVRWDLTARPVKPEAVGTADDFQAVAEAVAWTPCGRLLTADRGGIVKVWSATGKLERQFKRKDLGFGEAEKGSISVARLLPYGEDKYFAAWSAPGSRVGLSLLDSGDTTKCRVVHSSLVEHSFRSPAAAVALRAGLAALSAGPVHSEIVLCSLADGKERLRLTGKVPVVNETGWSKTSSTLAWGRTKGKKGPVHPLALDLKELEVRTNVSMNSCFHQIEKTDAVSMARIGEGNGRQLKITEGGKDVLTPKQNYYVTTFSLPPKEGRWLAWANPVSLHLADRATGETVARLLPGNGVFDFAPSPDGRFLFVANNRQMLYVYRVGPDPRKDAKPNPLLTLFTAGGDWIVWTEEGYYACSAGGEKLMGALVFNGLDAQASFHPVARFRDSMYRPDVIKLVLDKGNVKDAVRAANEALKEKKPVPPSPADLHHRLPPQVKKLVVDKSKLPQVTMTVDVEAGSKEQPIKSLRVFVDGRPFPGKEALKEYAPDQEKAAVSHLFTISLPDGRHQVAVLARSVDGATLSEEVTVDCTPLKDKPVMHVLAIGVNQYQNKDLNLSCAVNDADLIATTFKKACEGDLFHKVRTTVLPNEKATRKTILGAIEDLRTNEKTKAKPGDLVVVFFAGHGAKQKDQFYLLTHEADLGDLGKTALSGAALREALKEFPCQVLLILDACHAAAFGNEEGKTGVLAAKNLRPATDDAAREFTRNEVGVIVFCAAMGYERAEERGSHGLFTKHLAGALTETKDVPYRRDNQRQYINHIEAYVHDRVASESGEKQHPFLHRPWTVEYFALRQMPVKSPGPR